MAGKSKTSQPKQSQASSDSDSSGKGKALGLALESIEKQFGKGSIMKLGEAPIAAVRQPLLEH